MKQLLIRIDGDLKKKLKKYCVDKDLSMNELIVNLIKEELKCSQK